MASYSFNVDTQPMAEQIDKVSENVNGVSTAVVTMQTAVIAAETKATSMLCNKVNNGFYKLMLSQIAQKSAIAESEAKALVMELSQQSMALTALKTRMGKDFHMIATRYTSLFNSLNKALHNRIYELDKPTINFVSKDIQTSENRINGLIARVPVNQSESLSVSQAIAAGKIKHNASILIDYMKHYLKFFNFQRRLSEQIMLNEAVDQTGTTYVPIIISQSRQENSSTPNCLIADSNDIRLKNYMEAPILKGVSDKQGELKWKEVDEIAYQRITGEFNRYVATSGTSERVTNLIKKLYQQQKWQTPGEV